MIEKNSRREGLEEVLARLEYNFEAVLTEFPCIYELGDVEQEAAYHGEGNVLEHTRRVCQAVVSGPEWGQMNEGDRAILYTAALFHDIGKKYCTTVEDGKIISPNHSIVGMRRFREYCFKKLENRLAIPFSMREEIAWLIRYHGLPLLFLEKAPVDYYLVRARESVRLTLLYQLGRADVLGRECSDKEAACDTVEYFKAYAKEIGCWEEKITFANEYTRFTYFEKRGRWTGEQLYDTTQFDVYVMSGLPLSGKDTYIENELMGLPVVSLDDIRAKMGVRPDEPSGPVAAAAKEQSKEFLRRKQPFVWNATNILLDTRRKVCKMCTDYGARVHLIYREAPYHELLERNKIRSRSVPVEVIDRLIRKLDVPECVEAYQVEYP